MTQATPTEALIADFHAIAQKAMAFDVLHRQYTAVYLALNECRAVASEEGPSADWVCVRLKALALLLDHPPAQFASLAGGAVVTAIAEVPVLLEAIALALAAAESSLVERLPASKSMTHISACLRLAEAQLSGARRALVSAERLDALPEERVRLAGYNRDVERITALLAREQSQRSTLA
jgi:hypothetical protein